MDFYKNQFNRRLSFMFAFLSLNLHQNVKLRFSSCITCAMQVSLYMLIQAVNFVLLQGNLPAYYFESAFSMYESVVQSAVQANSRLVPKVQKELLQSLGVQLLWLCTLNDLSI